MSTYKQQVFTLNAIAAALLAAVAPAQAAEVDEVTRAAKPESTVTVGVGTVSRDKQRFGQYTGLVDSGIYGLFDVTLVNREDATGTTFSFTGRDLGLSTRDIRLEHTRQGDWGYYIEYNQIPRYSQYVVKTGLSGIGSANQTISGEPVRDVQLMTERKILTVGMEKSLPSNLDVQVRVRHEQKTGSRIFGRPGFDFLAEPIDSATPQMEVTLGYTGERLQLTGGYYGSWYNNHNLLLNASGGAGSAYNPTALPPDSESHQLHLAGGYSFSPTTRGTFKLAYGRALQSDLFIAAPSGNPNLTGKTQLDGRIDNTLLQLGLTTRPLPKLSLLANVRYEDRDDKTPIVRYQNASSGNSYDGLYEPRSITTKAGKFEAGYQLPMSFRVVGGIDYKLLERYVPYYCGSSGCGALAAVTTREDSEELTYRVKLSRSLSETVNGALSLAHSNRNGSDLLSNVVFITGNPGSNLISPIHLADRKRDQVRLSLDWTPTEPLSLQFMVDESKDEYSGRSLGPLDGKAHFYSLDASYAFSDKWRGTFWLSRNETRANQVTQTGSTGTPPSTIWTADLRDQGDAIGVGVRGKPTRKLELGADLQYTHDHGEYRIDVTPSGVTLPPDTHYRVTRVRLNGKYAMSKDTTIGMNYIMEHWNIDDWTWNTWTYADGTRLTQEPKQTTHFIGAYVQLKWW